MSLDTPALDQLAAEGMRFTNAYAAAPVCSPTRAAMMTGQSPARLRITNHAPGNPDGFSLEGSKLQEAENVRHLPLSYVTIAERLSEAGYATAHIGKWHLSYVAGTNKEIAEAIFARTSRALISTSAAVSAAVRPVTSRPIASRHWRKGRTVNTCRNGSPTRRLPLFGSTGTVPFS